jgi:hypothetical protein
MEGRGFERILRLAIEGIPSAKGTGAVFETGSEIDNRGRWGREIRNI